MSATLRGLIGGRCRIVEIKVQVIAQQLISADLKEEGHPNGKIDIWCDFMVLDPEAQTLRTAIIRA